MKDAHISLALSIVAHLCVVMLFAGLFMESHKAEKIIVADLTLMSRRENVGADSPGPRSKVGGNGAMRRAMEAVKTGAGSQDRSAVGAPQRPSNTGRTDRAPEVSTQTSPAVADLQGDAVTHGEQTGRGWKEGQEATQGGGTGLKGAGAGFGTGGTGSDSPGGGRAQGGSDYYYIRETVMKNIKYPEKARRMGQEGRVVLSFIVLENGATSEIKVISSCGFRLLDESAREGVMNTTIHKRVPYRMVVTLPITYKLQ